MISRPAFITAPTRIALLAGLTASGPVHAQTPGQWVVPRGFQVSVFADSVRTRARWRSGREARCSSAR